MASSLRGLLEKQFCRWSVCKTLTVLSACALLGLTIECEPGKAQGNTSNPPVINTTTQWTLDAPKLVSSNAGGVPGNSFSLHPNFSPDGTHLLFWSVSPNFPGAGTGNQQLYIKDLTTGAIALVSGNANGAPGNDVSFNPNNSCQVLMFSPDGTKVVFESAATNLISGSTTNGHIQIFVKDLTTGAVTLVSADVNRNQGNNDSQNFAFSPDGTKVAFGSSATNLLASLTHTSDIFVKDLGTGTVTLVSADGNGVEGNGASSLPVFSPDGTEVAFVSTSTNLTADVTNGNSEIFAKNLVTLAVTLVSADGKGVAGNGASSLPMFSPDGGKVAFNSVSTNLTAGSASGNSEIYVKDLATGAITLVSTDANGAAANSNNSQLAVFAPDGTKIAFESAATNLLANATIGEQVFVKDLLTGEVTLASTDASGVEGTSTSSDPNFSPDHKALAFQSMASNIGVTNGTFEIFVRPIFTASGAVVDPSATTLTTAGQLSFSDLDVGDTHTASVKAQAGDLGTAAASVSKDTTGTGTGGVISWNYQVDDALVHALTTSATDTFTVTLTDNQGCTATTEIVVTALPRDFSVVNASSGSGSNSTTTSSCPTIVATTTVLASSQNPSVFGQSVTFTATVTDSTTGSTAVPTGAVQFVVDGVNFGTPVPVTGASSNSSTATSQATTTLSVAGSPHTVMANYVNADGNFSNNSATLTGGQVVNPADTTTGVTSSQNPSIFGQSVTFTATVSPVAPGAGTPTGTITFLDGGSPLGTGTLSGGQASFTTSALAVASHTITTSYGGDASFNGSTGSLTGNPQVVNKANTATAVTSSQNPSVFGQSVTFTATVSPVAPGAGTPTGTVTFLDGGSPLGTGTLSGGQASFTTSALAVASHTITTSYGGDASFNGSTGSLTGNPQVVNKANTATAVTSSQNPSVFGQSVTFTATVSPVAPGAGTPTGTVTFNDGTTTLTTVTVNSTGTATFNTSTLAVASHSITAVYSGDGNFNGSSGSLTQNVQYSICVLYDQSRSVQSGATFPIKIQLCDFAGNDVSARTIILHATAVVAVSGFSGPVQDSGNANPDDDFRFIPGFGATGGYMFNLKTDGLASGTYSLQFNVTGDPVLHAVPFGVS